MHQHATVDADEPAGLLVDESERPAGPDGEPGMVTVTEFPGRRDNRRNLDSGEPTHPFQGVYDMLAFDR
jgi:hypothetical protein